jgi:predicted ATP-grasp superfamily ATP-dependent carboligase
MNVLVTDGDNRSALAVTRSLGRKGCNVFVAGKDPGNLSACSKYCRRAFTTPDPISDGVNNARAIGEIVVSERINVIFPMTEQSVYCLNEARGQLGERVVLACAPPDKMEAVSNKYKLFQLAEKLGVAIPETLYVMDVDDFLVQRARITHFPVVVKPAFSKIKDGDRIISTRVMCAATPGELDRLYEMKPELRFPSLIQEMIVGEGTGLFTLFDHDRHLELFSHRRILEKPPSGGVSVLSESVPLDDEMVESARKLLSEVGWQGIAMVEFKRDIRDGRAKLMEVNGRFWGSLQLAVSSGVDFPALCLDYHLGAQLPSLLSDYLVGHRLKWVYGIIDHLIIRLKQGDDSFNLPPGAPSRGQVIWEILQFVDKHTSSDVFDLKDLRPIISETKTYLMNGVFSKR